MPPAYLFLVVYSAAGLAIVGVPALGWDLRLVDLRMPEADLRPCVLPQLGLLGSGVSIVGICLGHPIVEGSADVLVGATLFLRIVGFAWPTRGGRQCWKVALSSRRYGVSLRPVGCPRRR